MTTAIVGYARTSTVDQEAGLEAQERDLKAAGCTKLFSEQVSSMATTRPKLEAALEFVREGDTFVVTRPDRLARSTADLLGVANRLEDKGVALRILSMSIDTGSAEGKLMLTILGGIAEFERQLMLERQREGIAKAKAEGKYKGRAPTARRKAADIVQLKREGKTADQIVAELGVSRSSVFRMLREASAD